eukprot:8142910-Alexandrium_andersonii.AAC.1
MPHSPPRAWLGCPATCVQVCLSSHVIRHQCVHTFRAELQTGGHSVQSMCAEHVLQSRSGSD